MNSVDESVSKEQEELRDLLIGNYSDSKFLIFLDFLPAIKIRGNHSWNNSLRLKTKAITHLSNELKTQYQLAVKEKVDNENSNSYYGIESEVLLIKFETLLNSVYSLCDNLAFLDHKLHLGLKSGFNYQRNNIEKYRVNYPKFSDYLDLIGSAKWYENLHTMRTESTHYLPGFVFHSSGGLGILYKNMVHSNEEIKIENINDYANDLISEVQAFLEKYGDYHLRKFLKDSDKAIFMCGIPHPSGKGLLVALREVTLDEYLRKMPGTCISSDVPCPDRNFCPANKG